MQGIEEMVLAQITGGNQPVQAGPTPVSAENPSRLDDPTFQHAMQLWMQSTGREPATDGDFQQIEDLVFQFQNALGDGQMQGIEQSILQQMGPDANMAQDPAALLEALLSGSGSLSDMPFEVAHPLDNNAERPNQALLDEAMAMYEDRLGQIQGGDGEYMAVEAIARLLEMMQDGERQFDQTQR